METSPQTADTEGMFSRFLRSILHRLKAPNHQEPSEAVKEAQDRREARQKRRAERRSGRLRP
jgi:hypothetical protein